MGRSEIDAFCDVDEPAPRRFFVGHGNGIFEISENDVDCGDDFRQLGHNFVEVWWKEMDDSAWAERNLAQGLRGAGGERFEEITSGTHEPRVGDTYAFGMVAPFDAVLFDAGGVLVVPDPVVLKPLLDYYGATADHAGHVRAHYAGMAAKSRARSSESDWSSYNSAYVDCVGVPPVNHDDAVFVLSRTRTAHLWRHPLPGSAEALLALHHRGVPIGVVSNASGQIEDILNRSGVCQVGEGRGAPMRCIVDSHVVGVSKPDPAIFDHALPHFADVDRSRIAYVGDSLVMDVEGSRAAGLIPYLMDPYGDMVDAPATRISSLLQLL